MGQPRDGQNWDWKPSALFPPPEATDLEKMEAGLEPRAQSSVQRSVYGPPSGRDG